MKHIFQIPSISIEQYQRMYNERRIYVLNLQREHRNFISRARYYSKNTSNDTKAQKKNNIIDTVLSKFERVLISQNYMINEETQKMLETESLDEFNLREMFKEDLERKSLNPTVNKFIIDNVSALEKQITTILDSLVFDSKDEGFSEVLNVVGTKYIVDICLHIFIRVLSFQSLGDDGDDKTERLRKRTIILLPTSIFIGSIIVRRYRYELVTKYRKENDNNITYLEWYEIWKKNNDKLDNLIDDKFYSELGIKVIESLFWTSFLDKKLITSREGAYYEMFVPNTNLIESVSNNQVLVMPNRLPMIVPPKPYQSGVLGGYLLNNINYEESLFIRKSRYKIPSTINNSNLIYDTVNGISSVPFKINDVLLDYLSDDRNSWLLLKSRHSFEDIPQKERSWQKRKAILSHNSKYLLQEMILSLAKFYRNFPKIYFPIKLDQRGRQYCEPDYLNYQGNELAKALLLFAEPGKIDKLSSDGINYIKAFGASQYGKLIDKKAFEEKIKWVDKNYDDIVNYETSDIVEKCDEDSRLLFLTFCIEMKRYNSFLKDQNQHIFDTYLPIQLDATCNGFQHLALLSDERQLFQELNLTKVKRSPCDFYSFVLDKVLTKCSLSVESGVIIDEKTEGNFESIKNFMWDRKHIKKAIMTVPYNVSSLRMKDYIVSNLEREEYEETKTLSRTMRRYYKPGDRNHILTEDDVNLLAKLINDSIFTDYSRLDKLIKYLKDVAKVCNKLKIPIIWNVPTGLTISQSYLETKAKAISPFNYSKTKLNLNVTLKDFDRRKQSRSLMPNLIHSLDASSLGLLYHDFRRLYENPQFYSVHDCFGTTADKADQLKMKLVYAYVQLYSDSKYLLSFDAYFKDYVKKMTNYPISEGKTKKDSTSLRFPDISWVIDPNSKKQPKLYSVIHDDYIVV